VKLSVRTITERFRESGRKVTPQRVAVFETLCERGGHPTVDQIYQEVRQRFPMISLNTVYQTMEALVRLKVVSPVGHSLEAARYETDPAAHHHTVCIACKRITDVFDAALGRVKLPRAVKDRFQVLGHRVEFYGYCADCQSPGATNR
jgi:Fur family peroxide stress response transcriptional regulator